MKVAVTSRSGRALLADPLELSDDATVEDLKKAFATKLPKYNVDRQAWTLGSTKISSGKLKEFGVTHGATLSFKDLGPQISWKAVFIIEYLGPLIIHPLWFFLVFGPTVDSRVQTATMWMMVIHFLKRELETFFVHRFSHATMPFMNVFKNSLHYHILAGALIAWDVYQPRRVFPADESDALYYGSLVAFGLFELLNLHSHLILRWLRPAGTTVRQIPRGFGFDWVSCPNYLWETGAWLAVCALTCSWSAALFTVVAVGQMYVWAVKKHRAYRKEFKDYPRKRKAMFPGLA